MKVGFQHESLLSLLLALVSDGEMEIRGKMELLTNVIIKDILVFAVASQRKSALFGSRVRILKR